MIWYVIGECGMNDGSTKMMINVWILEHNIGQEDKGNIGMGRSRKNERIQHLTTRSLRNIATLPGIFYSPDSLASISLHSLYFL